MFNPVIHSQTVLSGPACRLLLKGQGITLSIDTPGLIYAFFILINTHIRQNLFQRIGRFMKIIFF